MTQSNVLESSSRRSPNILLVAGEASGDQHGAALVEAYRRINPTARFWGMGGSKLAAAGMEITHDAHQAAGVNGFTEVVGKIGTLLRVKRAIIEQCDREQVDAAVLIDFPDFNLRLANDLHARGIRVFYFIAPQVWAWREGRVRTIQRTVSTLATIIPFEEKYFRNHGINAHYVGHPYLDRPAITATRADFCQRHQLQSEMRVVALLPGSRRTEVMNHLSPMIQALELLASGGSAVQGVIPVPDTLDPQWVQSLVGANRRITVIRGEARELLAIADAAIVKSGTSTIDAAFAKVPFCVIYKVSPLSYLIARLLVRGVKHIAMPNLVAGRTIVTEFVQHEVQPEALARELKSLLTNESHRHAVLSGLQEVQTAFQVASSAGSSAAGRAATLLDQLITTSREGAGSS